MEEAEWGLNCRGQGMLKTETQVLVKIERRRGHSRKENDRSKTWRQAYGPFGD